ncbi:luciferin 4-monooxygenase-like [Phymastichus coffea]|uniref:luciferin 4-monooxygenase-like n=1 Tax=Phymastichus coffea TaxID=108790 RepID=UPI00273CD309|nr:luciferin 4-monooxygenase-like [Phymastichus coffea]
MAQERDGFVIEDCIIKGNEKYYSVDADNLAEQLLKRVDAASERIWQINSVTGEETTYKAFKERSIRLAIWMRKEGVVAGDIVSVCSLNHPDIGSIILATVLIGASYNALPIQDLNLQLARYYVDFIKPRVMFVGKDKAELLQKAAESEDHAWKLITLYDDHFENLFGGQSPDEIDKFQVPAEKNPTHSTIIMPTSGTTGIIKFVCYSNERCMRWISSIDLDTEMKDTKRVCLDYLAPEWELHFRSMLHNVLVGRTQVFHQEFEPTETCKIIEKYKVNILAADVYLVTILCQSNVADNYDLQSLSLLKTCGTIISPKVVNKLQTYFRNAFIQKIYGSTETLILTKYTKNCRNPDSQGVVIPNIQLKICDVKTGSSLGHNEVGEIRANTPFGMTGYYKNPEANKLAYDNEEWFRMGDQGYYDENGELVIIGRLKEMIRHRLYDIYPSHIEELLVCHPNIVDAAIVGIRHEIVIEQPVAFVKISPETVMTEEDVLKVLSELDYSDSFKGAIVFIDEIPRSSNGKISRRILRERAEKFYNLAKESSECQDKN